MTLDEIMEAGGYELADAIELWLESHQVYPVLDWMARHVYVKTSGNGSWMNYAAR